MMRHVLVLLLLIVVAGCTAARGEEASMPQQVPAREVSIQVTREKITLDNGLLQVAIHLPERTLAARRGATTFISKARLWEQLGSGPLTARETPAPLAERLGAGRAVELTAADGTRETVALYAGVPFVCAAVGINAGHAQPVTFKEIIPLTAALEPGAAIQDLGVLGLDGLTEADKPRISYLFLAAARPNAGAGVVGGWLTNERGSGVMLSTVDQGALSMAGRSEYPTMKIAPGTGFEGETLALGGFNDARLGLEVYADVVARANAIRLRPVPPTGYCTWYHARALDQDRMAELAEFCRREHLTDDGLSFLQIDDGWQIGKRDYSTFNPKGHYSRGMASTAKTINGHGMTAGIWFIPFGWDHKDRPFAGHQDWFVHRADGSVYDVKWAGDCLDMTHPEARKFLAGVVSQMTREWNYKYIKIDGLWSGLAVGILYPQPTYRPDNLGDAVFHDPTRTNVEAFRTGLRTVRQAAGDDVFILGCAASQNYRSLTGSIGLVDAMRIGPDIKAEWNPLVHTAMPMAARLFFLNGRVWWNDPDCLMMRDPITLDQARAWGSLFTISGQLNVVSEWLPGLSKEKLDVVRRTMPSSGLLGRPVDLFAAPDPKIWHMDASLPGLPRHLVGLFNWEENKPMTLRLNPAELGLPASTQLVGFDFWENQFVAPFSGPKEFTLRPGSCRVLSLVPASDTPRLVSTSRHVTQGVVDVSKLAWDPQKKLLRGTSQVIAGDPYELRIVPGKVRATAAAIVGLSGDATCELKADGTNVRVLLRSPTTREISWEVSFQ